MNAGLDPDTEKLYRTFQGLSRDLPLRIAIPSSTEAHWPEDAASFVTYSNF